MSSHPGLLRQNFSGSETQKWSRVAFHAGGPRETLKSVLTGSLPWFSGVHSETWTWRTSTLSIPSFRGTYRIIRKRWGTNKSPLLHFLLLCPALISWLHDTQTPMVVNICWCHQSKCFPGRWNDRVHTRLQWVFVLSISQWKSMMKGKKPHLLRFDVNLGLNQFMKGLLRPKFTENLSINSQVSERKTYFDEPAIQVWRWYDWEVHNLNSGEQVKAITYDWWWLQQGVPYHSLIIGHEAVMTKAFVLSVILDGHSGIQEQLILLDKQIVMR